MKFFVLILCFTGILAREPLEWKLSGSIEKGYFITEISIGRNKKSHGPLITLPLYLDLETSATMIPSNKCDNCKKGGSYDRELSDSEELIACISDACDKHNAKLCPAKHTASGQCCSAYEEPLCGWDSRMNKFSGWYYAEGSIIRDEFVFGAEGWVAPFVDVLNSTFAEDLPENAVGVLGLGEKSCNPTCVDPLYTSIHKGISWADNVFTMCFGRKDGYLVIGTVDRRFQTGDTVWAYQRVNEVGYTYDVMDVRVNNETFYDGELTAEIVSSNPLIHVPKQVWEAFVKYMKEHYSSLPGVMDGTLFSGDMVMGIDQFPTIDIRLSGVLLHLSPYQYFLPNPMDIREFYLGLAVWGESYIGLGLVFLRGFHTVFKHDMTGFATAHKENCLGSEDYQAVGQVEWAPLKPEKHFSWMIPTVIGLSVLIVICLIVIILLKRKEKKMKRSMEGRNMDTTSLI